MDSLDTSIHYTLSKAPGVEALSCCTEFSFSKHVHDGYVLWINSEGPEEFIIRGKKEILAPGEVSIIEPGVVHANAPHSGSGRYLRSLYLNEEFFQNSERFFMDDRGVDSNLATHIYTHPHYWQLTLGLHEAIQKGEDIMRVEELFVALFSSMLKNKEIPTHHDCNTGKYPEKLSRMIDYMEGNYSRNIHLDDIALVGQCSSYYVIRLFKKYLGISPHTFLVQVRLEKARRLLIEGQSIGDSAYLTGFADQSHLNRNFKKRYGITPGMYVSQIFGN